MSDLISREALKEHKFPIPLIGDYQQGWNDAIDAIIDNAPKISIDWGKWIISEIQCPNCFEYFETDCYSKEELKKCPNCGAKMIFKGGGSYDG